MKFWKDFDRKGDSVGRFISAVEAFKVWACKKVFKGIALKFGREKYEN